MMKIWVDKTKPEELDILQHMESEAFKINEKYFEGGVLPGPPEGEKESHTWRACYEKRDFQLASVYDGENLIGGARMRYLSDITAEMELFFICPEYQDKGIGAEAFLKVENMFPEIRIWCLLTPTEVVRNAAFYINKCGYKIVEVVAYDLKTEHGMYVFEKIKY